MKRSNLIPITRIYDIYPKYTFSDDVKRFMDDIVDIPRAEVFSKDEVIAMLTDIQLEIEETEPLCNECDYAIDDCTSKAKVNNIIQQKIDLLQKQTTDNCDNCFNGTTKGGCAVKELMKNKDCKYYMPR